MPEPGYGYNTCTRPQILTKVTSPVPVPSSDYMSHRELSASYSPDMVSPRHYMAWSPEATDAVPQSGTHVAMCSFDVRTL